MWYSVKPSFSFTLSAVSLVYLSALFLLVDLPYSVRGYPERQGTVDFLIQYHI
jgi:hypothetical protein